MLETLYIKRILLIDDDADDREIFESAMEQLCGEFELTTSCCADESLEALRAGILEPDIIFLDLNMPRMDGVEFLQLIKQDKMLSHIPVIIFSTSRNFDNINRTLKLGAHDYITKPCTFDALVQTLSDVFAVDKKHDRPDCN
jgi:CheY-like chemotaxis protein